MIVYVSDLATSVAFYRAIGLEHRFTEAGYAEFATGAVRFALYERRRAEWLTGQPVRPGPAAEIVLVVDDVDAVVADLRAPGVPVLSGPADRAWGHRTAHVADPDGFVVEFAQEIPRTRSRRRPPPGGTPPGPPGFEEGSTAAGRSTLDDGPPTADGPVDGDGARHQEEQQ